MKCRKWYYITREWEMHYRTLPGYSLGFSVWKCGILRLSHTSEESGIRLQFLYEYLCLSLTCHACLVVVVKRKTTKLCKKTFYHCYFCNEWHALPHTDTCIHTYMCWLTIDVLLTLWTHFPIHRILLREITAEHV